MICALVCVCMSYKAGANCETTGTTITDVGALPGYFADTSGTNTVFFECFNGHCIGNGDCGYGYTGPTCTNCTDNRVLVRKL